MKKIIISIAFVLFFFGLSAQEGNLGIFAGTSYYNGEVYQRSILQSPSLALGILYRHNFDDRWSLRIGANYSTLKGRDANVNNSYQNTRKYSFSTVVWDLGPQVEFNFMKYDKDQYYSYYFTPYLTTGVLLCVLPDAQRTFEVAVPVGFGFKYAVSHTVTAGMEWSYRWTNSDEIDGLIDDNLSLINNVQLSYNPDTDWYSFIGAFVTVRVFKDENTCPAFMF
ncbi:MAG: hypothetical protein JXL97_08255 [Bacteroidales bacterium]|nr:hypothetical protein [Bacteroidales bacterium]